MKKSSIITISLIVLLFAGILFFSSDDTSTPPPSSELDAFAQCITDSGATLYGAWWCPHCEAQREMFGTSEQYLPYQECSLPSSKSQNLVCKKAGIECSLYEGTKHSSSSQLVNEYGYNLYDVQLATDHKDLSSVRHYAKIDLSARRNALDKKLKVGNE